MHVFFSSMVLHKDFHFMALCKKRDLCPVCTITLSHLQIGRAGPDHEISFAIQDKSV